MILLRLFWEFFKTGLFSVGGGMATLPFLYRMGIKTGWFTETKLADMIAVSESTPGPIGVNMATYVGFETAGPLGALVATLGLICPSILIILVIARILKQFRENPTVDAVFYGIRPCSLALISAAGMLVARITFLSDLTVRWKEVILAAVLLVLTRGVKQTGKLHPIVFIAASALAGILFAF
ncbi:MAG: chromate transporter [Oscillospiraceae bacterium]|nr:chromate transporter [Oscillospiraceae bacterium]